MKEPIQRVSECYETLKEALNLLENAYGALDHRERNAEFKKARKALAELREIAALSVPNDDFTHLPIHES